MRAPLLGLAVVLLAACETTPVRPIDSGVMFVEDTGVMMGTDAGPTGTDAGPTGTDAGPPPGPICPPSGPYGGSVGDITADIVLTDCDGVEHTLDELCERQAIWLFEFADWCPPCREFASSEANRVYDLFAGPDFAAYMIISEDSGFGTPDAADCAEIRDRYGIRMPVLFDPTGIFQSNFGVPSNEVNVVLSEGLRIEWIGQYSANMVESRIEDVLGR